MHHDTETHASSRIVRCSDCAESCYAKREHPVAAPFPIPVSRELFAELQRRGLYTNSSWLRAGGVQRC